MKTVLLIAIALITSIANAGQQSGTVNYVIVRSSDGLVYFGVVGAAKSGSPGCATGAYWMIRDENSNSGKLQYAMLLAAQASGKQVTVYGRNTCARWGDGEDVDWIQIVD